MLLDADGLSSAGSSNSLNSSCSSNRSSHHAPPVYFKAGKCSESDTYNAHLTWPYGSFSGDLDFDDMSPNLSRASSASSNKGATFGRSSLRETDSAGPNSDGKLSLRQGNHTGGALCRASSGSVKNGASNSSLPESSRALACPRRSRNGHSDSSGDSVAGSDKGSRDHGSLRTSPMAVPVPRGHPVSRQRQESVSSVGSWQIISGTGSLRGSTGSVAAGSANSRCSHTSM